MTTAEMLLPDERRLLSDYFRANVFDLYGSSEVNSLAFECPTHTGLHVAAEHVVLETKEDGGVLVTDLDNHAMPFIRYENGDLVEWKDGPCPCGRASPLIARVLGRRSELIRGPNGNRVFGEFFGHFLQDFRWIEQYGVTQFQIVQERLDFLVIRLTVVRKPSPEDEAVFSKRIRDYLGNVDVRYEYPETIPLIAGKRQFTISHLKNQS